MTDGTRAQIRELVVAVTERPAELPVAEIVALAASQTQDLSVDLSGDPTVVITRPRRHEAFGLLTRREREVAQLMAAGHSNRQIADALFISLATAKDHVHAILSKTGFSNRAAVIAAWVGSLPD